ncbi:MAG: TIGR03013 family XrtA/PEP-CTERM system glycosyltransferase [Desulfuromonadaceae bacterium]
MQKISSLLVVVDLALAALSLLFGHLIYYGSTCALENFGGSGFLSLLFFILITTFSSYFCELYRWENAFGRLDRIARAGVAIVLAYLMLSALSFILPAVMIGRGVLLLSVLIFAVLQFCVHQALMTMLGTTALSNRILVVGCGRLAETVENLLQKQKGNQVLVGYVQPGSEECCVDDEKILGYVDDLEKLVSTTCTNRVVVALTERRGSLPLRELLHCKLTGTEVIDVQTFYEQMTRKLLVEHFQPSSFIYANGFRISILGRFIKRVLDIFLSLTGIVISSPAWLIVAYMVRSDSSGPIFYRQVRVGEWGKHFTLYKFRTMREDAEKESGAVWATENDPRITKVGAFLRKTRLDELPQLINVLMGDMSFVGPRPERPEFVEKLSMDIPYYFARHTIKPGLTGWAQVFYSYGASEEDAMEKLRYDLYYLKNYSIILDVLIILETIKVVLLGRGSR